MPDRYQQLVNTPVGRQLAGTVGLPVPAPLRRYRPGDPVVRGPVAVGGSPDGALREPIVRVLEEVGAPVRADVGDDPGERLAALVFDASGIADTTGLRAVYGFLHPLVRHLDRSGRLVVVGRPPAGAGDARAATAQRALEGFVRSAGKEMRRGSTANLLQVADGAEGTIASTVRFLLSGRSAYVSGQVLTVQATGEEAVEPDDWDRPLDGRTAVVTGAAQGIGERIAEVLARDGAHVVCLDIPAKGGQLTAVANRVEGTSLQLDITAEDAPRRLADHLRERHGGIDVVVHNAGITRDRSLVGMSADEWDAVIAVNIASQERLNDVLLGEDVLRRHGRVVSISSVSGIAGNRGQTNYAASKAAIIGMVEALAPALAERGATINAVAPGFIESEMTGEMPIGVREVGRRMNSLNQGGLPVDVAETVAWLANPATTGVNGATVRVCGQSLLGA